MKEVFVISTLTLGWRRYFRFVVGVPAAGDTTSVFLPTLPSVPDSSLLYDPAAATVDWPTIGRARS